jgi:hypothetical protein
VTDRLTLVALAILACSDSQRRQQTPEQPPAAGTTITDTAPLAVDTTPGAMDGPPGSPAADTALGRCAVALEPPSSDEREVITALRAAYGLEADVFHQARARTLTREEVYAHYRQGFGETLAERLTQYSWDDTTDEMENALTIPDSVGVLSLANRQALLAWIPSTRFREQWGVGRCVVDRMVRENGRWIVDGSEP